MTGLAPTEIGDLRRDEHADREHQPVRVQLERIIGEAQMRQLLSLDAPDGGAYRDDPTLAFRARQLIPNLVRLREVLDAMGEEAAQLRRAIDRARDEDV